MTTKPATKVTLIPGDGIGPEVMAATQRVLDAVDVEIEYEECSAGAAVFRRGVASGVPDETIDSIERTGVVLKGPLETPVGYGEKSANVTLRKVFETYGNIRPARELAGIATPYSGRGIDLVIVRENVEDLYAGIEHMQSSEVAQTLKLITRPGCERIVRLAFEFARSEGREMVHCATKANIMKATEGLLKQVFEEVAPEYEDIEAHHIIVDNCAHQLVMRPEQFDVIVTTNMNGDILSDLTSGLIGGLGFAPSANIGDGVAIFEAVHGSAPDLAGKNLANPTAMLQSAVMMLRHIGEFEAADRVEQAVLVTLEERRNLTKDVVGHHRGATTRAFTDTVISNLGRAWSRGAQVRRRRPIKLPNVPLSARDGGRPAVDPGVLAGLDIFVEAVTSADALGSAMAKLAEGTPFRLGMVSNRGTKVWPDERHEPPTVDFFTLRYYVREGASVGEDDILNLLGKVGATHTWSHVERLRNFAGMTGFSKAQGED